ERNPVEQALHVSERRNRNTGSSYFAGSQRMVGIHSHLRGEIESYRQPGGSLRKQIAVAAVALLGGAEAGILPHGPEAAPVHVRVNAAGEGELAGLIGFAHDREILRARRKEEMPYPAMMVTNPTIKISRNRPPSPRSSSRSVRMPEGMGHAASTKNRKPMISCQRVCTGLTIAGMRWRTS